MLLAGRGRVVAGAEPEAGFLVRCLDQALVVAVGHPEPAVVAEAVADGEGLVLIAPLEASEHLAQALPGWRRSTATLHSLAPGTRLPEPDGRVRLVTPEEAVALLPALPPELREDIAAVLPRAPLAVAAAEDGSPAAFCYACWQTETLWDISIDTLEAHRRRGHAERVTIFLIHEMRRRGKEPVWGAEDDNVASLRLAAKLGFIAVDRLAVFKKRE